MEQKQISVTPDDMLKKIGTLTILNEKLQEYVGELQTRIDALEGKQKPKLVEPPEAG